MQSLSLLLLVAFATFLFALAGVAINMYRMVMGVKKGETWSWKLLGNPFNALLFPWTLDDRGISARRKLLRWLIVLAASGGVLVVAGALSGTLA